MHKLISLFVLMALATVSYTQTRQINKMAEDLEEGRISDAQKKLARLEENEGKKPEVFFARYLFLKKAGRTPAELDSAQASFFHAFSALVMLETKDREKLCKEIAFCEIYRDSLQLELDRLVFNIYCAERSRESVLLFVKNYPESQWKEKGARLLDSIDFVMVIGSNDIARLEEYVSKHPRYPYNDSVRQTIYHAAYSRAVLAGSIGAFEEFLSAYPEAPQREKATSKLIELHWARLGATPSVNELKQFIERFPSSKYDPEARKLIEGMEWVSAERSNSAAAYRSYFERYPLSSFSAEAKSRYDRMRQNVFPFLTASKKYRLYDVEARSFLGNEEYDHITIIGGGRFIVTRYQKLGLVDNNGKSLIPATYNCINRIAKFLSVKLGDKYALFDMEGTRLTDHLYQYVTETSLNGYVKCTFAAPDTSRRKKIDLFDRDGQQVFSSLCTEVTLADDSTFIVESYDSYSLVSRTGRVLTSRYSNIAKSIDGLCIVQSIGKYGLISTSGVVLMPPVYESISQADSSAYFIVLNKQKQQAIADRRGNIVLNFQSRNITDLGSGMFLLQSVSKDQTPLGPGQLYDADNNVYPTSAGFESVNPYKRGIALAVKDNKAGYIDRTGKWVVSSLYSVDLRYLDDGGYGDGSEPQADLYFYDDEESEVMNECNLSIADLEIDYRKSLFANVETGFFDGLALVQIDSLYGFVNSKGGIAIPIIYSLAGKFVAGLSNVTIWERGKYIQQVINTKGEVLFDNAYISDFTPDKSLALINQGGEWQVFDLVGLRMYSLDLSSSHEYLEPYPGFFVSHFKGKQIVVMPSGQPLMDPQADFSAFDFKAAVSKVTEKYLNNEYQAAVDGYETLLQGHPESFTLNYMAALCYRELKDDYNYQRYINRAIELKPDKEMALTNRMDYYYEGKYWRKAVDDLNALIAASSTFDQNLYFKRAYSLNELGRMDEAFSDYSTIINRSSNCPSCYNNRGGIYMRRGQYLTALNDFNSAIKGTADYDKENLGLYYENKGSALYNLKRNAEGCAAWRKAASYGRSSATNYVNRLCR